MRYLILVMCLVVVSGCGVIEKDADVLTNNIDSGSGTSNIINTGDSTQTDNITQTIGIDNEKHINPIPGLENNSDYMELFAKYKAVDDRFNNNLGKHGNRDDYKEAMKQVSYNNKELILQLQDILPTIKIQNLIDTKYKLTVAYLPAYYTEANDCGFRSHAGGSHGPDCIVIYNNKVTVGLSSTDDITPVGDYIYFKTGDGDVCGSSSQEYLLNQDLSIFDQINGSINGCQHEQYSFFYTQSDKYISSFIPFVEKNPTRTFNIHSKDGLDLYQFQHIEGEESFKFNIQKSLGSNNIYFTLNDREFNKEAISDKPDIQSMMSILQTNDNVVLQGQLVSPSFSNQTQDDFDRQRQLLETIVGLQITSCIDNSTTYDKPYILSKFKKYDFNRQPHYSYTIDTKYGNRCTVPYIFEYLDSNNKVVLTEKVTIHR